jgi:hypothetical protein
MGQKIVAVLLAAGLVFWIWYYGWRQPALQETAPPEPPVAEAPAPPPLPAPRKQDKPATPIPPVKPATRLAVPLQQPLQAQDQGQTKLCKDLLGVEACADADWKFAVETIGPLSLSESEGIFHASIPVRLQAQAGVSTEQLGGMKIQERTLEGTLTAWADLQVDPTDGCSITPLASGFEWLEEPQFEMIGGLRVKVGQLVAKPFEKLLRDRLESLARSAPCESVRKEIARFRQQAAE